MIDANAIREGVGLVQAQIADACARVGRDPESVTLIAVSKFQPTEAVLAALEAGVRHFGENRAEDALAKIAEVGERAAAAPVWHMIGHVQSRKARLIYPSFAYVHSVDRLKLAQKLAEHAQEVGVLARILLEVNISGEASKEGYQGQRWAQDEAVRGLLWREFEQLLSVPNLRVEGLMTMAPYEAEPEQTRPVFRSLAALRGALARDFGLELPILSMGMTNDYPIAVEEGATHVRVGRAIFGERSYPAH